MKSKIHTTRARDVSVASQAPAIDVVVANLLLPFRRVKMTYKNVVKKTGL